MAKHTRIYTRTGDDGTTGLYSGERVQKTNPRIEAYGTVDELSSAIGVAVSLLGRKRDKLDEWLGSVQDTLFDLGAELATPGTVKRAVPAVRDADVESLERAIDESETSLPALDTFIHPGGSAAGAALHVARTVCRRAERRVLTLRESGAHVDDAALRYLNRLSDALFVWARTANAAAGVPERCWKKRT